MNVQPIHVNHLWLFKFCVPLPQSTQEKQPHSLYANIQSSLSLFLLVQQTARPNTTPYSQLNIHPHLHAPSANLPSSPMICKCRLSLEYTHNPSSSSVPFSLTLPGASPTPMTVTFASGFVSV